MLGSGTLVGHCGTDSVQTDHITHHQPHILRQYPAGAGEEDDLQCMTHSPTLLPSQAGGSTMTVSI